MKIELEKAARNALARTLAKHLNNELDIEIGGMDAMLLVDFISKTLGASFL